MKEKHTPLSFNFLLLYISLGVVVANESRNKHLLQERQQQQQQQQQAAVPKTSSHKKEDIDQLVNLGFAREEAIAALDACDGNVEYAAGLLFQG